MLNKVIILINNRVWPEDINWMQLMIISGYIVLNIEYNILYILLMRVVFDDDTQTVVAMIWHSL